MATQINGQEVDNLGEGSAKPDPTPQAGADDGEPTQILSRGEPVTQSRSDAAAIRHVPGVLRPLIWSLICGFP